MNNLAVLLYSKGDYGGAEPLCRRALEAHERVLGPRHPNTLGSLNNLAELLKSKGDYAGAEPLYRRALEAHESVLGPGHPNTLLSLNNLAALLYSKGDYAGAEPLLRRALETRERVLGAEHPDTLGSVNNLAVLLYGKGDYAGAEPLYRRGLEGWIKISVSIRRAHPNLHTFLNNYAGCLGKLGRGPDEIRSSLEQLGVPFGISLGGADEQGAQAHDFRRLHRERLSHRRYPVGRNDCPRRTMEVLMLTKAPWVSRPVFVTSTFADMQAERDHLRDHVFPVLEERLRQRRHNLEPIDLRWGVETVAVDQQHAKELLVLKVCLGEIRRSRPFLIGLIGDRYGWAPPEERMKAAIDEEGFATDLTGKSITALEIEYGALADPDQQRRSRFYFRDPLPYDRMRSELAALFSDAHRYAPDAAARLAALKERLSRDLPDRVRKYAATWDARAERVTGLEAWGRQVLEDLWSDLDEETRAYEHEPPPTWQEEERWVLEQFVEDRARGFVGRTDVMREALELATSAESDNAPCGLCITGKAGAGKSALFAHLCRELERQNRLLVLTHAAGISVRAGGVDAMLRRWIGDLAHALGISDPLAESSDAAAASSRDQADPLKKSASAEEVEQTFARLLGRVSNDRRVVLLVDALNQFERTPRSQHLAWLPLLIPPNVRLVATTIPGTESEALARRPGARERVLPGLHETEATAIAQAVCRRYHRDLNPKVLQALVAKKLPENTPAYGNPLWLQLAVEELNLLDADDFSRAERQYQGDHDVKLRQMMLDVASQMPPDVEGLYGHMLDRAEKLAGWNWAMAFANLITVTRSGLRESDLSQLLPTLTGEPWDDLRFATLRRAFRRMSSSAAGQVSGTFSTPKCGPRCTIEISPVRTRSRLFTRRWPTILRRSIATIRCGKVS